MLRVFRVKILFFFFYFLHLSIVRRGLDTEKTTLNIQFCPESVGAMLDYWYIERNLSTHSPSLGLSSFCSWHDCKNSFWSTATLALKCHDQDLNFTPKTYSEGNFRANNVQSGFVYFNATWLKTHFKIILQLRFPLVSYFDHTKLKLRQILFIF